MDGQESSRGTGETTTERRPEPPQTTVNGPHAYRGDRFRNREYIAWVKQEVQPLKYDIDERVILTHGFDELGDGSGGEEPEVVLMTQTSPERLPFVRRMLALWNGPATVSVYIPYPKLHPEAARCAERTIAYMDASIKALSQQGNTSEPAVAVSLLYSNQESPTVHCEISAETTGLEEGWRDEHVWAQLFENRPYLDIYDAEYPVGSLRQLALDLVPEESFAFLVDADFVLVTDFHTKLKQGATGILLRYAANAWKERSERHAVIVPAFQREPEEEGSTYEENSCAPSLEAIEPGSECWMYNQYAVPLTEASLQSMLEDGSITGFYEDKWSGSHGCYVPSQAIQHDEPFSIAYTHPCEPYVIGLKPSMPRFDGRWRGRMLDKTAYITHMAAWGFEFHVNPTSFMVHLPHASGAALKERPDDPTDQVFADFWALPYGLTRVFLDDIRKQPESQCEVIPMVLPLEEEAVVSVLHEDGATKAWCRDADVSFDWSRISRDFSAPHSCTSGTNCAQGGDAGNQGGVGGPEVDKSETDRSDRQSNSSGEDQKSPNENGTDDPRSSDQSSRPFGESMHVSHRSSVAGRMHGYLRGALGPSENRSTMLWSAAGVGILAWVLFVWFYHSTLRSRRNGRRRFISMQLSGSADFGQGSAV